MNIIDKKLSILKNMKKYKKIAKFLLCAFALSGLFACGSGGGGGSSSAGNNGGGSNNTINKVHPNSLNKYTLANLDDTFLNEVTRTIADNSIDKIVITISNSSNTRDFSVDVSPSSDKWKTATVDITSLVNDTDGAETELSITITYFNGNTVLETTSTTEVTIIIDSTPPSIRDFTDIDLPITNNEGFAFTLTFSENINTSTFTTADILINLADLVTTTVAFNGTKNEATITAITDIPETQQGNLTITVRKNYQDEVGNEPTTDRLLYTIDVERPRVTAVSEPIENTNTPTIDNDYTITYTFSEPVVGITAANFDITGGSIDDITHDGDRVDLAVTSTEDTIEIRVSGFTDNSGNVGIEKIREFSPGQLTVTSTNSMIGDGDIQPKDQNYTFVLRFTDDVSAETFTTDDFTTTDTNIEIINITPTTDLKNFTVEFKFLDDENTANVDITIDVGKIENADQTNKEDIVISIDRAPRIISITGDPDGLYNINRLNGRDELTLNFQFSEPITGFTNNIFTTTGIGITTDLQFTDGDEAATLDIGIDTETDGTLTLQINAGHYTDLRGNNNSETTYNSPRVYRLDNVRPFIESSTDINTVLPITDNKDFTFELTFSDDISIDTVSAADFTIAPSVSASITTVTFDGQIATITATTDIPETATGDLTISIGEDWKDTADNTGTAQTLYTIDVQLPTVLSVDNEPIESGDLTNDYTITYTFSEEVVGITASNFEITDENGTIDSATINHNGTDTVTFTVT